MCRKEALGVIFCPLLIGDSVITQPQSVLKPCFSRTDLHLQADTSNSQSQTLLQITFSEAFSTLLCFDGLVLLITAVCRGTSARISMLLLIWSGFAIDMNDQGDHTVCTMYSGFSVLGKIQVLAVYTTQNDCCRMSLRGIASRRLLIAYLYFLILLLVHLLLYFECHILTIS